MLFVFGGLFEQFVKYRLGQEGRLRGAGGFHIGLFMEVAGYIPFGLFVIWRVATTRQFPRLAGGVPLAVGILLILIGFWINYRAVQDLKLARWNSAPVYGAADEFNTLVKAGIYSRIRHPSYLGQIIMFGGCAILVPSPYIITFAATFALYTIFIHVRIEEAYLIRRFGEQHMKYVSEVSAFLPLKRVRR